MTSLQTSHKIPVCITGGEFEAITGACIVAFALEEAGVGEETENLVHGVGRWGIGKFDPRACEALASFMLCEPMLLKQKPGLSSL